MIKLYISFLIPLILLLTSCTPGTQYTLWESNDIFKPTKNRDQDFSQGVQFLADVPDSSGSTAYFVGQNFFTPPDKDLTTYQLGERPYAGFLYGGADFKYKDGFAAQNTFGVTLGIIGPHAFAEEAQNGVHKLLGQREFQGWDLQLEDEPGIILKAERQNGFALLNNTDLVTTLGLHAGNVFTQTYSGATFRFGHRLPHYFGGPSVIYPRLPQKEESKLSYYLFGGPWFRAVAHNIFLDGNTVETKTLVDKEPFILEGRLGFAVEYGLYRFAYTYVVQTDEYETQNHTNDFGNIDLSIGWK